MQNRKKKIQAVYQICIHFLSKLLKLALYSVTNYSDTLVLPVLSLVFFVFSFIPDSHHLSFSFFFLRAVTSNEAQRLCMRAHLLACLFLSVFDPCVYVLRA